MTKESVELVKELIQAVLPLLVFIFIVILFIIYRKRIERFSTRITKIKGKIAGQEFETEIKDNKVEIGGEKSNKSIDVETIEERKSSGETLYHVWAEYDNQNSAKALQIFEQVQLKESDSEKRVHNEIFHFYIKSLSGDVKSSFDLEEYAKTIKYEEKKYEAYEYLGLINKHSRSYNKAIEVFNVAMGLTNTDLQKADIVKYISECYYELSELVKAEDVIRELFEILVDDKAKCVCLKNLAELYDKQKKYFLRAITLEKAIEYEPNNTDILFKLAYSYSECNLNALAILHYKTLLFFEPKSDYALNNIGVSYNHFGLPLEANKSYKASSEIGNTLASGNLASNLISGGFYLEAKKIIDEAKSKEKYDIKIDEAYDALNKKEKAEKEKIVEILEFAKKQERFFKKMQERQFVKINGNLNLIGDWILNDQITVSNLEGQNTKGQLNTFNLSWDEGKIELSGVFDSYISRSMTYIDPRPGYTTIKRNSICYAFIKEGQQELEVLVLVENSQEIIELSLKRVIT